MKTQATRSRRLGPDRPEPDRSEPSDDLAPVWRGLSSSWRRQILDILSDGPLPTGELARHFPDLSRFAVMQHLRVLEAGGLVMRRKAGRRSINHMNPIPIQQIYQRWVKRYQEPWAEALVGLKAELERDDAAS